MAETSTIARPYAEALFRVAQDTSRPFTVKSYDLRVRAIGTQFDVYRKDSGTTVSVVEGRVALLIKQPRQTDRPAEPESLLAHAK